jgi:hypothetical protein
MYLFSSPAPEESIILRSFFLSDIVVFKGMLCIFGLLGVVIIILWFYTTFEYRRITLSNGGDLSSESL